MCKELWIYIQLSDDVMEINLCTCASRERRNKSYETRSCTIDASSCSFFCQCNRSHVAISLLPLLVKIKRKLRRIGEWTVSRTSTCTWRRENAFMSNLTDLRLLFHFSPYTNRNRIGQWMCTGTLVPLVAQKFISFAEFSPTSYQIVGEFAVQCFAELLVYVQCARCKTWVLRLCLYTYN